MTTGFVVVYQGQSFWNLQENEWTAQSAAFDYQIKNLSLCDFCEACLLNCTEICVSSGLINCAIYSHADLFIYLLCCMPFANCIAAVVMLFCKYVDFSIVFYNLF